MPSCILSNQVSAKHHQRKARKEMITTISYGKNVVLVGNSGRQSYVCHAVSSVQKIIYIFT